MSEGAKYTLYDLPGKLAKMQVGDTFKIKGHKFYWEYYDLIESDWYWIRNTVSKQLILIKKD